MMPNMRALVLRAAAIVAAAGLLAAAPHRAHAQVVRPPIGSGAINAAKKAAEKTNEQIKAAEQAGGAQQKSAPPKAAPQKSAAAPPKAGQKAGARADTAIGAVSQAGGRRPQVTVYREAFAYVEGGRRDPFVSLMLSGELRPIITDLTLTGVLYDPDSRKSLAMLVDASTGESYRVRTGQALGRMRVQRIGREDVTFSIDEFGLSRTETLVIDKSKKGPATARRP